MSDLIYNVTTLIDPKVEEEFNAWQVTEHCPYLMTITGYHCVIRYKDIDRPHEYLNCWHIESLKTFNLPERAEKAATPWGRWLSPYRNRRIEFYARENWENINGDCIELDPRFSTLISLCLNNDGDEDQSFLKWCDEFLIPEAKKITNVLECQRYTAVGEKENFKFLIYIFLSGEEECLTETIKKLERLPAFSLKKLVIRKYRCTSKHDRTGLRWLCP